ncbi:hypothetical protein SAMN06265350_101262 [Solitalea koreensis]|uniref:Carboxypeptidase regulatory-like domain-containing protein n=2 Tax=Solitalea koreensis TaxID=543615 RepID=A0A521AMB7_9SPHI|nr:hypothetical protein SAMN06265350_101262 [Solitalea koreensis]
MIRMIDAVLIFIFSFVYSAKTDSIIQQSNKQSQGIEGVVFWRSGNQMPSPDESATGMKGKPIVREIVVFKLTKTNETKQCKTFFSAIKTAEVGRTRSDSAGYFLLKLPPGNYSIFVREEKGLFANRFDGHNNICPVEVKAGEIAKIELIVDYAASY